LLLSITGPYLLVSGFIFADYAVQQALTPQLLLWDATPDDSMTQSVVRTLWAVRTFLQELPAYYQQILRTPPSRVPTDARFPYFVTFAEDGCTFRLRYLKRMFPDQANRNIFLARVVQGASTKLSHNQLVVVKFSTRYGKDAHATLAQERLAPRMYHHSELPGGILVTVMEYLQGRSLEHGYGTVPPSRIHAPVRRAIEILHAQNIVFGDLRLGNIMLLTNNTTPRVISRDISSSSSSSANVEASRVMLIDFDWCAKEGEGKYPPLLNTKVDWADGVEPEGVMMKSHDEAMLARLSSAAS
jgi:serine/threonine protein kinase